MISDAELFQKAKKRAEDKVGFLIHLGMYVIVNAFLVMLWWVTTGGTAFPWFVFPMFGWAIGLVAHFLAAFLETGKLADRWTREELERLRKQRG